MSRDEESSLDIVEAVKKIFAYGKYDEYGQRREVGVAGCAIPMQQIESIDEPRREAAANNQLPLFE